MDIENTRSLFMDKILTEHDFVSLLYFIVFIVSVYFFGLVFINYLKHFWSTIVLFLSVCIFFVPVKHFGFISIIEEKVEMIYLFVQEKLSKLNKG